MFTNRIKEFREKAGLTQLELARRAKVAPSNLCSVENGKLAPWTKMKRTIARVLKTTPEELFPEG